MLKIVTLICLLFIVPLSGCSSQSDAVYKTNFDFSQVKSYSIYQRNSAFTDTQSLTDARRNSIEIAIEKEFDKQGFIYKENDEADIIITYHLLSRNPDDYRDYNKAVLFCHHCLKANNWYKGSKGLQVKAGNLIIDLIDTKKKRSVWRNIAPLNLKDKDNSREVNSKIQENIATMLAQYPKAKSN